MYHQKKRFFVLLKNMKVLLKKRVIPRAMRREMNYIGLFSIRTQEEMIPSPWLVLVEGEAQNH